MTTRAPVVTCPSTEYTDSWKLVWAARGQRFLLMIVCTAMSTVTSHQDATASPPRPHPTQPVAGRLVPEDVITFHWTPVPEASGYRIQITSGDDFDTPDYDRTVEAPVSIDLEEEGVGDTPVVYWRVAATGTEGPAQWSETAHFATKEGGAEKKAVVVDAEPIPTHPSSGKSIDVQAAAFVWDGVPEATGYNLQIMSESEQIVDLTVDGVTSVVLYEMLPEGTAPLRWRVRSLFPSGETGPWSPEIAFQPARMNEDAARLAPSTEVEGEREERSARGDAVAAGPARRARTTSAMSLAFIAVVVLGFLFVIFLTALLG